MRYQALVNLFSVVSGPKFTRLFSWNAGGIAGDQLVFPILDILTRSGDIRDRTLKLSEIAPNFACFWPPISLRGGPPEFLDLRYKERPYCDHVTKFHGDRPTELAGSPANKKTVKHKAFGTNVPGGLNSSSHCKRTKSNSRSAAPVACNIDSRDR